MISFLFCAKPVKPIVRAALQHHEAGSVNGKHCRGSLGARVADFGQAAFNAAMAALWVVLCGLPKSAPVQGDRPGR